MPNDVLTAAIELLLAGEDLGRQGATRALGEIMAGRADEPQTAAFLIALRAKGESAAELAGLAEAIRDRAVRV